MVTGCMCPEDYVYRSTGSDECIKEECCACPDEPPCDEGPNYSPIIAGVDDCGCNNYTTICECTPECKNPITNDPMAAGSSVPSDDGCGTYTCPDYDPSTNPLCNDEEVRYIRDPCPPHLCEGTKLPQYNNDQSLCCPEATCVCPNVTTPNCTNDYETLKWSSGDCPTATCECECPTLGDNCTASPGCKVKITRTTSSGCICPISWECVPQPELCPEAPNCTACYTSVPKNTVPGEYECDADCDVYQCQPVPCPDYTPPNLPCPTYQHDVNHYADNDTDECCPMKMCECNPPAELKDECPMWYDYECEDADYIRNRTNDENECCPEYECVCNQQRCPEPIDCKWLRLESHWPSPIATGTHEDVCCASFNCTCVDVPCPPKPETCPDYQKLDERDNTTNPCCPVYTCKCDPTLYPDEYSLPVNQPSADGTCNLPGQIPEPETDESGCLEKCVCYPTDEVLDHCYEYQVLVSLCKSPKTVGEISTDPDDLDHVCCPKVECSCPPCGDSYVSKEDLEADLAIGEIVVAVEPFSECCQEYKKICNTTTSPDCPIPSCEAGYKRMRNDSNTGCCQDYYCACEEDLCDPAPNCTSPKQLTSERKLGECCKTYECKCPPDNSADLVCILPEVDSFTSTPCPTKRCRCPDVCPNEPTINCTSKPGCRAVPITRDKCDCVVNASCIADPSPCDGPPDCPTCYTPQETGSTLVVGDCNSTCLSYKCEKDPCPNNPELPPLCLWNSVVPNTTDPCCPTYDVVCNPAKCPISDCQTGYHGEFNGLYWDDEGDCTPGLRCCPKEDCICDVCIYNGEQFQVGQEWSQPEVSCNVMMCTGNRTGDCFQVIERKPHCDFYAPNGTLIMLTVGTTLPDDDDPCKSKECQLEHINNECHTYTVDTLELCPPPPQCSIFHKLDTEKLEGVCCASHTCVCKPCLPDDTSGPGRDRQPYEVEVNQTLNENPNQVCCPRSQFQCAGDDVLMQVCEEWNFTCEIGKERLPIQSSLECCPQYICVCKPCPKIISDVADHACHVVFNKTLEENPLQECCPATKVECMNDTACCGSSYETYEQVEARLELGEEVFPIPDSHECCPQYEPVCKEDVHLSEICARYNVTCLTGFRPQRKDFDIGCCHVFHCVCNETLCPPKPPCELPKEYNLTGTVGQCCNVYECVCPPDDNETIVCEPPKEIFNSSSVCPKKYCRCPESLECPVNPDVTECSSKPGCRSEVVERDSCDCVINSTCVNDPTLCPPEPDCGDCFESKESGLLPGVGDCQATCTNYTCERKACDPVTLSPICDLEQISSYLVDCCPVYQKTCKPLSCPNVTCGPGYSERFEGSFYDTTNEYSCSDPINCCPIVECVCVACFDNGVVRPLGSIWPHPDDPCLLHICSSTLNDDGCYSVITQPSSCVSGDSQYPPGSILPTGNPCTTLVCEQEKTETTCITSFVPTTTNCPRAPLCSEFHIPSSTYHTGQCCPEYECICNECGENYPGPGPSRAIEWYEKVVNMTTEENKNQFCCPLVQIVCNELVLHQCPEYNRTCGFGETRIELNSTHPCCPKYECRCRECCVAPPIDPSMVSECQEIVDIPIARNPNHLCCPEKEVVCKPNNPCCSVPECGEFRIANKTVTMNANSSYCCPNYECVCSGTCHPGYQSRQQLEDQLKPGQEIVLHSADECCPVYRVVCSADADDSLDCAQFNIQCESPYRLQRNLTDFGCCGTYYCECHEELCPDFPKCDPPKQLIPKSLDSDSCCHAYECECPQDTSNVTCVGSEIVDYTATVCPNKYCRCPESLECPLNAAINCTAKPGCRATVTERDSCGCVLSATCSQDQSLCPAVPDCGTCFEKVALPAPANIGECDSSCSAYTCERIICEQAVNQSVCPFEMVITTNSEDWCCPKDEVVCLPGSCPQTTCDENYLKVVHEDSIDALHNCTGGLDCCKREECVCNVCHHNGSTYQLHSTWLNEYNLCLRHRCTEQRGDDGCYVVNNVLPHCIYNNDSYPIGATITTHNPCIRLRCIERYHSQGVCTHDFKMDYTTCPPPPVCSSFYLPTAELSPDTCCPNYTCECASCGANYLGPETLRVLEWFETARNYTFDENPNQICCPLVKIVCDDAVMNLCPTANLTCEFGYEKVEVTSTHPCCPTHSCQCKPCRNYVEPTQADLHTCETIVEKNTEENPNYQCCPESKIVCQDESCCAVPTCDDNKEPVKTGAMDPDTNYCCPVYECQCKPANILYHECAFINFTCPVGFKRTRNNSLDECCPTYSCLCETCALNDIAYPVGSSWIDDEDHCQIKECVIVGINCPFVNTTTKYQCDFVNETECVASGGQLIPTTSTDGCCETCKACAPTDHFEILTIVHPTTPGVNCTSAEKINVPICDGACTTTSEYNVNTAAYDSVCRCCQATNHDTRSVELQCTDTTTHTLIYDFVNDCACHQTECGRPPPPPH
uniref:Neurogenic locus notch homolog protein 1-like n=1 Tax=Phallusia mammillata TaxID=59560 RepID=A0A6F9DLU8_9ASCI|nr:neurogenic locus notch homolog protein 1-like [Phallusia mammillata]